MHATNPTTPWTAAEEYLSTLPEIVEEAPRKKDRVTALRHWLTKLEPHIEYLPHQAVEDIIKTAQKMCPADAAADVEYMIRYAMTPATLKVVAGTLHQPGSAADEPTPVDSLDAYGALRPGDDEPSGRPGVSLEDFHAYMPAHSYIFTPSREMWPASSVNARIPPIPMGDDEKKMPANAWLDRNKPVEQMTWAPGLPMLVRDRLIAEGGWIERNGVSCFNLYKPPAIELGEANKATKWIDLVKKVYPNDCDEIFNYCAHRRQRPEDKINHSMILGGAPGIGKDTILEALKQAVGPWNFREVSPQDVMGPWNDFMKSVVLRISEVRDLGDVNRYSFYEHTKTIIATPPDVARISIKYIPQHYALNVCGVIYTTNHKTDGIYLPADDRRTYVAWSDLTEQDFEEGFWIKFWHWYQHENGFEHVAAYLAERDISKFDAKAPPIKTAAFWAIVDANQAPEDAELADVLDRMGNPEATTMIRITAEAMGEIETWLKDRKNRRAVPHRLEKCGYVPIRNDAAKDGLWKINGTRQVVYAQDALSIRDQLKAASSFAGQ